MHIFHTSAWARVLCDAYGYFPALHPVFEKINGKRFAPSIDGNPETLITGSEGFPFRFPIIAIRWEIVGIPVPL